MGIEFASGSIKKELGEEKYKLAIEDKIDTKEFYCTKIDICVNGIINYKGQELKIDNNTPSDKELSSFIDNNKQETYVKNAKFIIKDVSYTALYSFDENKLSKLAMYDKYQKINHIEFNKKLKKEDLDVIKKINKYIPYNYELKKEDVKLSFIQYIKSGNEYHSDSIIRFIDVKDNKVTINYRYGKHDYVFITFFIENNDVSKRIYTTLKTEPNVGAIVSNETSIIKFDKGEWIEENVYKNNVLVKTQKRGQ